MIRRTFGLLSWLLLIGLLFAARSPVQAQSTYADACQAAQELEKAGKLAESRDAYNKALAVEGITPEQGAQVMLKIASSHMKQYQWSLANATLEKIIAMEGINPQTTGQAHLMRGQIFANYGGEWGWGIVKEACSNALATDGITPEQKVAAQKLLMNALVGLREYADARGVMMELVASESLAPAERANMQLVIAKLCLAERNFDETRAQLEKAAAMEGLSPDDKADIQLILALSYYYAQDDVRARTELQKVLEMPGADSYRRYPTRNNGYTPADAANLKLHMRKLTPAAEPAMAVLFIGSSMTTNGDIPGICATISATAPAGQPRILPEIYARNGTKIDVFWNDGDDSAETARRIITDEPWDAVVLEIYHTLSDEDMSKYVKLFTDLIKSSGAKAILYAAPVTTGEPYRAGHRAFLDKVNALARSSGASVAPAAGAYMYLLGENPTQEQFNELYNGSQHPSAKGSYVIACSYYAALTGNTPVGIAHPGISDDEARKFQEAVWKAFQDSCK